MISIPGHEIKIEQKSVQRFSSIMNSEYLDHQAFIVCACGWEKRAFGGIESRVDFLEHIVEFMAEKLPDPALLKRAQEETPALREDSAKHLAALRRLAGRKR